MKKNIKLICFLLLITQFACINNFSQDYEDIMTTFYNYDTMFYINEGEKSGFETGDKYAIYSINEISDKYQKYAKEYLNLITEFINTQISTIKCFFVTIDGQQLYLGKYLEEKNDKYIDGYNAYQNFKNAIYTLMENNKELARVNGGFKLDKRFEVPRILSNGESLRLPDLDDPGIVYWAQAYLWQETSVPIDKNTSVEEKKIIAHIMNKLEVDYWFYESNLKLCVVRKIYDNDGKYYGELSMDFYKLDKYNELFDKEGNPKVKK